VALQARPVELAGHKLDLDPQACFMIGDGTSDIELGQRAGATAFYLAPATTPRRLLKLRLLQIR
jgi:phosphoglycolate phosphatase-like HAD superfamily hydrolase